MAEAANLSLELATAPPTETVSQIAVAPDQAFAPAVVVGRAHLIQADCLEWLSAQPDASIHAVVTDPPYGLVEYTPKEQEKLRRGRGGVWRLPPSFDGCKRSPLPRFTTLTALDLTRMERFFHRWGRELVRGLVPGAHAMVASNPLVVQRVTTALVSAGFEPRGQIIRLVMTMRGGDRPKNAHQEFDGVSVMPRSMWEPWILVRKPIEGRVKDNLRRWGTGGLRRPSTERPFGDVIRSHPTRASERAIAPHPSLKPQGIPTTSREGLASPRRGRRGGSVCRIRIHFGGSRSRRVSKRWRGNRPSLRRSGQDRDRGAREPPGSNPIDPASAKVCDAFTMKRGGACPEFSARILAKIRFTNVRQVHLAKLHRCAA